MKSKKKHPMLAAIVKGFFGVVFLSGLGMYEETGPRILALILGLALLAWAALPFLKKKKKTAPSVQTSLEYSGEDPLSFDAVGMEYRRDAILSLAESSRAFDYPDDKFLEKYPDGRRIYKYSFQGLTGELVPEPTNPHDPDAIKVQLNGVHVAYVPAILCKDVLALLKSGYSPRITVKGGPYKYAENGTVQQAGKLFFIHVYMNRV